MSNWPCSINDYSLVQLIGKGSFSNVWKAVCNNSSNNQEVALKVIDLESINSNNSASFEDILHEVCF